MKSLHLVNLAWLFLVSPALAGGLEQSAESFEPTDAEALIDACWQGADLENQNMSVESRREAAMQVVNCHEAAILRLMKPMFDPEIFSQEEARKLLREASDPIGTFYFYLLAHHRKCSCGTDGWISSRVAEAKNYEGLLRQVVEIHRLYKY